MQVKPFLQMNLTRDIAILADLTIATGIQTARIAQRYSR